MARNPRIFRRTATLVTVVLATTGMSNAATFFEGLGLIPGSMQGSINAPEATGISADGTVAVGYSQEQAFRWTQSGGMVGLGFLNLMNGHGNSYSMGTSSNGSTVAGYSLNASAKLEAFRWTQATGMIGLGYLPGGVYSTASAINSNGSVVVGTSNGTADPSSQGQAFRWTQTTGIVGLGFLPGTNYSSAAAVNYSGSIVVGGS
jgi:probable HAF family extracellular repeat protein